MTSKENGFKVRLSRTSSAQAVLKKERKKSVQRLDEIIQDDKSMDTVTGKLPVEAAYVVLKRVTEEVGQPLNTAGISTYNKLQSMKTSPAVDLLLQKTWREFFSKKTEMHNSLSKSPARPDTNAGDGFLRSSGEEVQRRQKEMRMHMTFTFDRLVSRVEQLWKALKLPSADQAFYRKTLCKGPPQSMEQCREVARYIIALKAHQEATVAVIQAIQARELAIAKCFDVLAALQRKFSRILHREQALNSTASSGFAPQNSGRFRFTAEGTGRPDSAGMDGDLASTAATGFWKEEIIVALDEVRSATLEVIRNVQRWRRHLWRPHPFVYMGVNYVAKMRDDLTILESSLYTRLLALVPLKLSDLQCVVFFSSANKIFVETASSGTSSPGPPGSARGFAASSSFPQLRSSAPTPHQQGAPPFFPPEQTQYIEHLLHQFATRVSARELQLAATVVLEEEVLQNALSIEQASLLQKGVFIPTLHFGGAGENGVVARSDSHQSLTHPHSAREPSRKATAAFAHADGDAPAAAAAVPPHYSNISYGEHPQQQHQPFQQRTHLPEQLERTGQRRPSQQHQHYSGADQPEGEYDAQDEIDWAPDFAG